jgi:two-component system, OmpR family, phosphate regulon sensor histidine kinase PhoR
LRFEEHNIQKGTLLRRKTREVKLYRNQKIKKMKLKNKFPLLISLLFSFLLILVLYLLYYYITADYVNEFTSLSKLEVKYALVFIYIFLFLFIALYGISFFFSRKLSKKINSITEKTNNLISGSQFDLIPLDSNKEINLLADSINNVAKKIEEDKKNMEKLERIRTEFLANVSHELRTPIFSIQGYIETLLDGAVFDQNVNIDFLTRIQKQSDRLNTLLNDLIEISRIESKDMKFSFRFFDFPEFLYPIIEEMKPIAGKKNVNVIIEPFANKQITVFADRDRIKQVVVNLIDNAVKYNKENGEIIISIEERKESISVSVKDSGVGIPEEHLERIFERFYRVDKTRSREVGGTGLGLAIVKHIVEAHKGEVTVESKIGEGSKFTFTLSKIVNFN